MKQPLQSYVQKIIKKMHFLKKEKKALNGQFMSPNRPIICGMHNSKQTTPKFFEHNSEGVYIVLEM